MLPTSKLLIEVLVLIMRLSPLNVRKDDFTIYNRMLVEVLIEGYQQGNKPTKVRILKDVLIETRILSNFIRTKFFVKRA